MTTSPSANKAAAKRPKQSSGVQELIDRIRVEGVEQGRLAGERELSKARDEADAILAEAKREAERTLAAAREEARRFKRGGEEALQLAARDAALALKAQLEARFRETARRLVSEKLDQAELLERLILKAADEALAAASALAGSGEGEGDQARDAGEPAATISAPAAKLASEGESGDASKLADSLARELLEGGVELKADASLDRGLRVKIAGGDLEADLSEQAVTDWLLARLLPRFRSALESSADGNGGGAAG